MEPTSKFLQIAITARDLAEEIESLIEPYGGSKNSKAAKGLVSLLLYHLDECIERERAGLRFYEKMLYYEEAVDTQGSDVV